jgi:hypothetical protein
MKLHAKRRSQDRRSVVQPFPGWVRIGTARDHMNPRSRTEPSEGDSRRLPPAVSASQGWIVARVCPVAVGATAHRR